MKIDYSISDFKKQKNAKCFLEKQLSNIIRVFFNSKLTHETKISISFGSMKINLELIVLQKNLNLNENYAKSE